MATTQIRGGQILDGTVQRHDISDGNPSGPTGIAVVRKIVQGTGITLTSTGYDAGTGDVTVARAVADGVPAGGTAGQILSKIDGSDYNTQWSTVTSNVEGIWQYATTLTMADPGSGKFRLNNAVAGSATLLAISKLTSNNTDRTAVLATLQTGDQVILQDQNLATSWIRYNITGAITNNSTWFQIPIASVSGSGTTGNNNDSTIITFEQSGVSGGGGGGNVSNSGTPTANQIAQWTDATHIQGIAAVGIAQGGTGQITAAAARGPSGLNIEGRTVPVNTANYTILNTDRLVSTQAGAFTAPRTWTLPDVTTMNAGALLVLEDGGGAINGANTLTIAPFTGQNIGGQTNPIVLDVMRAAIILETNGSTNWNILSRSPATKKRIITSGTTYAPTVGAKALWVECIGGGGGGGGALGGSSQCGLGGGGGGGSYAAVFIAVTKASYTIAVGTGGAGGVGAAVGSAGGSTTFDSPSVCTAGGGAGGSNLAVGTASGWTGLAGTGGAASVGDIQMTGGFGTPGYRQSGTSAIGGQGGSTPRGGAGSNVRVAVQNDGGPGAPYGSGGGGACSLAATSQTGGVGAAGAILVTEFF